MNYFYKKFIRLLESKNFLKIKYFIQKYFKNHKTYMNLISYEELIEIVKSN